VENTRDAGALKVGVKGILRQKNKLFRGFACTGEYPRKGDKTICFAIYISTFFSYPKA
jgi:hypothetical protein